MPIAPAGITPESISDPNKPLQTQRRSGSRRKVIAERGEIVFIAGQPLCGPRPIQVPDGFDQKRAFCRPDQRVGVGESQRPPFQTLLMIPRPTFPTPSFQDGLDHGTPTRGGRKGIGRLLEIAKEGQKEVSYRVVPLGADVEHRCHSADAALTSVTRIMAAIASNNL